MFINLASREGTAGLRTAAQPQRPPPAPRQAWLDALRGVAVLVVVFEHLLDPLFPEVRANISPWFNFGQYGVMLFFLVSGYVVPVSLERRGSVAGFWINRLFRLYPLWIVTAIIGTAFGLMQVYASLPGQLSDRPVLATIAHLTMVQDLLQVVSVVNVFWTLSYEMVFYLLVTAMFVFGWQRASAGTALTFATAGVLVGGVLPAGALSSVLGGDAVVLIAAVVLAVGMAAILGGGHRVRLCGAATVAVLVVVLLGGNSRIGAWQSLAIVATMFAGTALYRLDQGQVDRARTGWAIALVPVATITAAVCFGPGWGMSAQEALEFTWSWSTAVAAAWVTFLIGRLLRSAAFPDALVQLGLISYAVYLLHPLAIQVLRRFVTDGSPIPWPERLLWSAVLLGVVLVCATVSYRFIERPAQRLGRRLAHTAARDPRAPRLGTEPLVDGRSPAP
ncbi:acyltransferase family protein [Nonomuraea glycinis]|uniref:acyltransferase family protein n=1 Tax=Nonomuraea glycinis TaxID=2047744 RepID=UPI002E11BD22|nr:acyltransferase [Nonomuraea glycinis]